jgi:hypothetical protein
MTRSNSNKSAAPTRALSSASSLALAAVVALEVFGAQALTPGHARWNTAAAADGSTIYTSPDRSEASVVADAAD